MYSFTGFLRINRNIVECKVVPTRNKKQEEYRINRNIVECKELKYNK